MNGAEDRGRQQLVAGHRQEDARLAEERDQQHAGHAGQGAGGDEQARRVAACCFALAIGGCLRNAAAMAALRSISGYGSMPVMTADDEDVEDRAKDQRREDGERHVALRVDRLFGVRADRVEADEREEDDRGAEHDARQAVGGEVRPHGVVDRLERLAA